MYGDASGKWDNISRNFLKRRKPNPLGISVEWFVTEKFDDFRIFRNL